MANLILTRECQNNCDYCFANNTQDSSERITLDKVSKVRDFLKDGPKVINLIGGEPTRHHHFHVILEMFIKENFTVQVFTNGRVSTPMLEEVKDVIKNYDLRENQLLFCVNSNTDFENKLVKKFLMELSDYSYISHTISEVEDLTGLVDIVNIFDLDRTIRLGLALPRRTNKYLDPKDYRAVGKKILELSDEAEEQEIDLVFDCGFPVCMFDKDDILKYFGKFHNDFMFFCGQPLDIYPNLEVANCFPLADIHTNNLSNFEDLDNLTKYFKDGFETPNGIFPDKCEKCILFKRVCSGGCKGFFKPK